MGAAIHADDLRTSAPSTECVILQEEVIDQFPEGTSLKLNQEKLEVVKSQQIARNIIPLFVLKNRDVSTSLSARCPGVWWNSRHTAKDSVPETINKSRRSFFCSRQAGSLSRKSKSTIFL